MYLIERKDAFAAPTIGAWPIALIWTDPPLELHSARSIAELRDLWKPRSLVLGSGERSQDQIRQAIQSQTRPGELVVDPFCGTGTAGLVALAEGRNFYGCDTDLAMVRRTKARLATGDDPG